MVSPGRPRRITTDRIVEAGRRLTLPQLSIRGVARELGVSEMSIYRIVGDLEGLRAIVAEGIIAATTFPGITADAPEDALVDLAHTLRDFVIANPGIGQHLARLSAPQRDFTLRLAEKQQAAFATRFGLSPTQASLLVSTVAEHAVALGEITPPPPDDETPELPAWDHAPTVRAGAASIASLSLRERFDWSIRATARGALSLLGDQASLSTPEAIAEHRCCHDGELSPIVDSEVSREEQGHGQTTEPHNVEERS